MGRLRQRGFAKERPGGGEATRAHSRPCRAPALISSRAWLVGIAVNLVLPCGGSAKWVDGTVSLGPKQAKVVTKFCFDFRPDCWASCPDGDQPGMLTFNVSAGRPPNGVKTVHDLGGDGPPRVHIALLDDEYFSFPEVSQVWDDLSCSEVLKAAKKSWPLDWKELDSPSGQHLHSGLVERFRPRWWYIAFVSCSDAPLELSFQVHLLNRLRVSRQELSMDEPGVLETFLLALAFGAVATVHFKHLHRWRAETGDSEFPAPLRLLTASAVSAAFGAILWLAYYWSFSRSGRGMLLLLALGRGGAAAARTFMSLLLMLLAQGECVATSSIAWSKHAELVGGLFVFGALSFALELYGDSQFQTTTTEYIYDTTPGTLLVAFDLFWLWVYVTRAWRTFQTETRAKQRRFYKTYGAVFSLWFASLPVVAAIARVISPWLRFYVMFLVTGAVHLLALGALVHTFSPDVAPRLYELGFSVSSRGEAAINDEELSGMLHDTDI